MRVHDSQACRKMDVTMERISRVLELTEILLLFQTDFNLVNAAAACAILESISGLKPSSVITEPRYSKLLTEQELETVTSFKYLGSVITDEGSKPRIFSRTAQTAAALTRLKSV